MFKDVLFSVTYNEKFVRQINCVKLIVSNKDMHHEYYNLWLSFVFKLSHELKGYVYGNTILSVKNNNIF